MCESLHVAVKMYRVRQIKVIPYRVLLISQKRIGIFKIKFTRLFFIHIYVQLPNYVKLSQHAISIEATPRFVTCKVYALHY